MDRSERRIQLMWRRKDVEAIREHTQHVVYNRRESTQLPENVIPFPKPRK